MPTVLLLFSIMPPFSAHRFCYSDIGPDKPIRPCCCTMELGNQAGRKHGRQTAGPPHWLPLTSCSQLAESIDLELAHGGKAPRMSLQTLAGAVTTATTAALVIRVHRPSGRPQRRHSLPISPIPLHPNSTGGQVISLLPSSASRLRHASVGEWATGRSGSGQWWWCHCHCRKVCCFDWLARVIMGESLCPAGPGDGARKRGWLLALGWMQCNAR